MINDPHPAASQTRKISYSSRIHARLPIEHPPFFARPLIPHSPLRLCPLPLLLFTSLRNVLRKAFATIMHSAASDEDLEKLKKKRGKKPPRRKKAWKRRSRRLKVPRAGSFTDVRLYSIRVYAQRRWSNKIFSADFSTARAGMASLFILCGHCNTPRREGEYRVPRSQRYECMYVYGRAFLIYTQRRVRYQRWRARRSYLERFFKLLHLNRNFLRQSKRVWETPREFYVTRSLRFFFLRYDLITQKMRNGWLESFLW